jgi:hypothetical protein
VHYSQHKQFPGFALWILFGFVWHSIIAAPGLCATVSNIVQYKELEPLKLIYSLKIIQVREFDRSAGPGFVYIVDLIQNQTEVLEEIQNLGTILGLAGALFIGESVTRINWFFIDTSAFVAVL